MCLQLFSARGNLQGTLHCIFRLCLAALYYSSPGISVTVVYHTSVVFFCSICSTSITPVIHLKLHKLFSPSPCRSQFHLHFKGGELTQRAEECPCNTGKKKKQTRVTKRLDHLCVFLTQKHGPSGKQHTECADI